MKFSDAIAQFKEWKGVRYQRASVTYSWEVKRFEKFIKKPLNEIEVGDLIKYQVFLKKKYSGNTQATATYSLRSFFAFTNKRGMTNVDVSELLTPRVEEKVPVYVVQEEFQKLCDIAKYETPQALLAIRLLWFTGVRVSELCDIRVDQVDLKEKYARIQSKKSFKPKQVFWDDETNELLEGVIKTKSSEYVFPSPYGGALNPKQVQRWVQDLVKKAGLPKHITPHAFRHGATKEWLNNGVDLPAIKDLLGHKNLMSVEKYTKRLESDIREKGREAVRHRSMALKFKLEEVLKH